MEKYLCTITDGYGRTKIYLLNKSQAAAIAHIFLEDNWTLLEEDTTITLVKQEGSDYIDISGD